jgi:hypothetical protein
MEDAANAGVARWANGLVVQATRSLAKEA